MTNTVIIPCRLCGADVVLPAYPTWKIPEAYDPRCTQCCTKWKRVRFRDGVSVAFTNYEVDLSGALATVYWYDGKYGAFAEAVFDQDHFDGAFDEGEGYVFNEGYWPSGGTVECKQDKEPGFCSNWQEVLDGAYEETDQHTDRSRDETANKE